MPSSTALSTVVPMVKPAVSYISVDPATAARWLGSNKVNRSIRLAKVNQYANDMRAGRWTLSNDAICFAPDGTLLNGQHRLHAVMKADLGVVMLVARNMPPESMTSMDIGSSRTAADALGFDGEKSTHMLAASSKLAILYREGRIYRDSKQQAVSPNEIRDFVADNPIIRHSVSLTTGIKAKIDCAPSVLATAHWIIADRDNTAVADHYLSQLATRAGEPEDSAVLAVDSRLRQLRRNKSAFSQRAYLALLIKGWNHYAKNNGVTSLTMSASGRIPDPLPWMR